MTRLLIPVAAILLQATAFADGGTVQLRREAGPLAIALFTSPAPLTVGRADISLLIQDRNGLDPLLDADVWILLRHDILEIEFEAHPTREQARNKLLYAAPVMFSKPGKWQIDIVIDRKGTKTGVGGILEVAPAPSKAVSYAGYFAFPPVMVMLFIIRQRLINARSNRRQGRLT
jgi:hypothetical protein